MADRLANRVVLVCGAGSIGPGWGNGKATSVLLTREGARVFAVDIDLEAAEETRSIVASEDGVCVTYQADVSQGRDVAGLVSACVGEFGRIDVLVNVVGVAVMGGVVETTETDWDRVTDVNLKSCYLTCKNVIPVMEEQGSGSIVNLSSVAAHRWTGVAYTTYYATKGAMVSLSRAIALEYAAKGIRCNTVCLGSWTLRWSAKGSPAPTGPRATSTR